MNEIIERWFWSPPPPYQPSYKGFEMWCYDQLPPHLREAEAYGSSINYEHPKIVSLLASRLRARLPRTLMFDMERTHDYDRPCEPSRDYSLPLRWR